MLEFSLPGEEVAQLCGSLLADLARCGEGIATMDLRIDSSSLAAGAPLVTRNVRQFERIRELRVLGD